ncbi:MAG: glycosyltransferase family 87 protein [Sedimentisphaerales bacterium]
MKAVINHSRDFFITKQTPYTSNQTFPPLTYVLFAPLLAVTGPTAHFIITIIDVVCYIFITLLFPMWTSRQKPLSPMLMLFFISGLFSYGFQFELERGQFNVITMFLCLFSIWIYHYRHRYRYLAYSMFSISIQLKLYPAIFIVMFIRDWDDWKSNIKRFLGLAAVNLALFFILGPKICVEFLKVTKGAMGNPGTWFVNHSIQCFVTVILTKSPWAKEYSGYSGLIQVLLLAFVAVCIFLVILQAYRQRQTGINPYMLLACTIGAMLIPAISYDYKLSILAAPVAMVFHKDCFAKIANYRSRLVISLLIFAFCAVYSSTLFSYCCKPPTLWLLSDSPALMALLLITTVFSLMREPTRELQTAG